MKGKNQKLYKMLFACIFCISLFGSFYFFGLFSYAAEQVETAEGLPNTEETQNRNETPGAEPEHVYDSPYDEEGAFTGMVIVYGANDLIYLPELPETAYSMDVRIYYFDGACLTPDPSRVKWTSDNLSVFQVDENGMLHANGVGTANLTAEYTDDENDEHYKVTQAVTINEGSIVALKFEKDSITTFMGINQFTSIYAVASNGYHFDVTNHDDLNFAFEDPDIASLSEGVLKPCAPGHTKLIVSIFGQTAEIDVTVINPINLTLTVSYVTWVGDTQTEVFFTWNGNEAENLLTLFPDAGYFLHVEAVSGGYSVDITEYVTWSSSDTNAVEVSDGFVYGSDLGKATITISYSGKTLTIPVEVVTPPVRVYITGEVKSYNPKNEKTIQLKKGDEVIYETIIPADETGVGQATQPFTFEDVAPGTYTLVITKPAHTPYTVQTVEVTGDADVDLTQDSRIPGGVMTLRCGDLDGDGVIGPRDLAVLWSSKNYMLSSSEAENPLADLDGDGTIGPRDLAILWNSANYMQGEVVIE